MNSEYTATDNKKATVLVGLDISSAFDTVAHDVLLLRLQPDFGVGGAAVAWLHSYLADRKQHMKLGQHSSATMLWQCGVPRGLGTWATALHGVRVTRR